MRNKSDENSTSSLRQQAESLLEHISPRMTAHLLEHQRLLHTLQVHQMELELQNEELHSSQVELQIARDKYAALYDLAPVGYLTLDERGTILEANLTAATLLGVTRITLLGTSLTRFIARDDQDTFYLHRRQVFEEEGVQSCDLQMQRPDGSGFVASLKSHLVLEWDGQQQQCFTTLSDVTARQQAETTLRQAERLAALGTFAAGIAHELNNPLGAITVTAEHAQGALSTPEAIDEVHSCLDDILEDAQRCAQIVRRILHFARQGLTDKSAVDLHAIIRSAYDLTLRYAEQHGVHLRLALAPDTPCILANTEAMELVFVNLIRNAVEAGQQHTQVTIRTAMQAGQVCVRVQDMGAGLTEEERERVFDPFYTTRQHAGGTGLGLSITHRIIMDHDGSIDIQSIPGQGTTVCLCLPLAPAAAIPQV